MSEVPSLNWFQVCQKLSVLFKFIKWVISTFISCIEYFELFSIHF